MCVYIYIKHSKLTIMFIILMQDAIDGSGFEDFDSDTEVIRVSFLFSKHLFASYNLTFVLLVQNC